MCVAWHLWDRFFYDYNRNISSITFSTMVTLVSFVITGSGNQRHSVKCVTILAQVSASWPSSPLARNTVSYDLASDFSCFDYSGNFLDRPGLVTGD